MTAVQSQSSVRLLAYLDAVKAALEGSNLFKDVRVWLDPYSVEEITKENTQVPAARVCLMQMTLDPQARSSQDLSITFGIAVIAGREGRPNPQIASADIAALGLVIDLAALIQADPYFGITQVAAAKIGPMRVVSSEKGNDKGLAITLLQVNSILLENLPVWPGAAAIFDATRSPDTGLTINDSSVELTP